jgi:hypothetical protein
MKKRFSLFFYVLIVLIITSVFILGSFCQKKSTMETEIHFSEIILEGLALDATSFLFYNSKMTVFFADMDSTDKLDYVGKEDNFLNFMRGETAYYQLRYIDEFGMEKVKVIFEDDGLKAILREDLQNKSNRDYFIKTMSLQKGEVFISTLDLNVENNALENKGTEENPIYVPVVRYSTPVFNEKNKSVGIIVMNIYADYFLDNVRNLQKENIFVINQDGYYLANNNKSKEFGFDFGNNITFFNDFSLNESFLEENKLNEIVKVGDKTYILEYVFPDEFSHETYLASERLDYERYWVYVYVYSH